MSETLEEYLKKVFFDPKHPAFFAGPRKLQAIARKQGYNPPLSFLKTWTSDIEAASLHKPSRKKFETVRGVSTGLKAWYDVDLASLIDEAPSNDNFTFWLVVIDVFSRKVSVTALKNKSALEVKRGMQKAFDTLGVPSLIRSDAGKEFLNNVLKKYLNELGVYHQVSRNLGKAVFAERCIKSLKLRKTQYQTLNDTPRYIDQLDSFVQSYNESVHSSTGMTPNSITPELSKRVWWKIYKPKKPLKAPKKYAFRIGDKVRISYLKHVFFRAYDQNWTGEVFSIVNRIRKLSVPLYKIKDMNNEVLQGMFYTEELQLVHISENKLWKIHKIIKRRTFRGKRQVLVRWLHFPPSFDSWIAETEVSDI